MADDQQADMLAAYLASKKQMGTAAPIAPDDTWNRGQAVPQMPQRQAGGGRQGGRPGWGGREDDGPTQPGEVHLTVRNFLEDLSTSVTERRSETLDDMYIKEYPKLCEQLQKSRLGKSQKWPTLVEAAVFLGDSHVVHLLYKELYYRHIFARLDKALTIEDRVDSYDNYQLIFEQLQKDLQSEPGKGLLLGALPRSWLWDLIDEFLYQYQSFCQFKAKTASKRAKNIAQATPAADAAKVENDFQVLKENSHVFETQEVYSTLRRIKNQSNIDLYLKWKRGEAQDVSEDMLPNEDEKFIGYFAYIQIVRYHLVLAEYEQALKVLNKLDYGHRDALYYRSPSAHVNVSYYSAFALFMQGRFSDCASILSKCLYFVFKVARFPPLATLYDTQYRTQEKMVKLLLLATVYGPDDYYCKPEDSILQFAEDKYTDDVRVFKTWGLEQTGAEPQKPNEPPSQTPYSAKLVEWFNNIAPKFITIIDAQQLEQGDENPLAGHDQQWEAFYSQLDKQKTVPMMRTFMRMYTKMSVKKMQSLCGYATEEECRRELARVREAQTQLVMEEKPGLSGMLALLPGRPQRCTDIAFDVEGDAINVKITPSEKDYETIYLKEIRSLASIHKDLVENAVN